MGSKDFMEEKLYTDPSLAQDLLVVSVGKVSVDVIGGLLLRL